MSKSILRDRYMRKVCAGKVSRFKYNRHPSANPHCLDEMPKNKPSKLINTNCSANVSWLVDAGSFGGHSRPRGGHRRVSGLVRAALKRKLRMELEQEDFV